MTGQNNNTANNTVIELKLRAQQEPIASFLKMRLEELTPGYARVKMPMLPEYLNFNKVIYGGIVMSLADFAFAYASNSLALPSVASQFNIYFLAAAAVGDELTAECNVLKSGRRAAVSEITVTNQEGKLIAKATGQTIPMG
ncbi:MAG: PaaI family thioesterase [Chloroflexi bacterium]|nr:PaaI family thioesterase [Chloroflexota bacterium]